MQTFVANFFRDIALTTGITIFALAVNLWFWWKYLRRSDDERFWIWPYSAFLGRVQHAKVDAKVDEERKLTSKEPHQPKTYSEKILVHQPFS
jgi:hypothetical protein